MGKKKAKVASKRGDSPEREPLVGQIQEAGPSSQAAFARVEEGRKLTANPMGLMQRAWTGARQLLPQDRLEQIMFTVEAALVSAYVGSRGYDEADDYTGRTNAIGVTAGVFSVVYFPLIMWRRNQQHQVQGALERVDTRLEDIDERLGRLVPDKDNVQAFLSDNIIQQEGDVLQHLQTFLEGYRSYTENVVAEREQLRAENTELRSDNTRLQTNITEQEREMARLRTQNRELEVGNADLRRQIQSLQTPKQ